MRKLSNGTQAMQWQIDQVVENLNNLLFSRHNDQRAAVYELVRIATENEYAIPNVTGEMLNSLYARNLLDENYRLMPVAKAVLKTGLVGSIKNIREFKANYAFRG
jgi:hypothetical protein